MEIQREFKRGIHLWVIAAEDWDVDTWRVNLKGVPSFFKEAARKMFLKSRAEREVLSEKATTFPSDSVDDYVRYEIMADLSTLTNEALEKVVTAIDMNATYGEPLRKGEIDWDIYGHD